MSVLVVAVVVTALVFDFTNGFHDTANAMATSIATRALSPRVAVLLAGALNLIGAFLSVQVAKTISSGLVDESKITPAVVFGALVGAVLWNLLTWLLGLPSSSSHALFGGLIGATWVFAGAGAIKLSSVVSKVLLPMAYSPIVAGAVALVTTSLLYKVLAWVTARRGPDRATSAFRRAQVVSASAVALAHGTNDAQKTMGVITLTLVTAGLLPTNAAPPQWVIVCCALAIALGTSVGGWRIIRTLGKRISEIHSPQGFVAETASASVILTSAHLGFAVSTTQVTTGSIFGAGAGRRLAAVHWGVARRMAVAWLLTLPAAAVMGAAAAWVAASGTAGTALIAVAAAGAALTIFRRSRRSRVDAATVNELPAPVAMAAPVGRAA